MWEWHALGHIPASDSFNRAPHSSYPWDYVHINSIDPGGQGDVLLSFRNTWSLDDVDIHSGGFRWRIGGVHSSFKLGPGREVLLAARRRVPGGRHDLAVRQRLRPPEGAPVARAAAASGLRLPHGHARQAVREPEPHAARVEPGQHCGGCREATGCSATGGCRTSPSSTHPAGCFSTARSAATCRTSPPTSRRGAGARSRPPRSRRARARADSSVAVSWNGATDVSSWRVLAGSDPAHLAPAASAAKSGFETTIAVPAPGPWVAVQALDGSGAVLAVSPTVKA